LIGGPPCQGFSNIGRRDGRDGRNHLFGHFFRLVDEIRPAFFLVENVPGILNSKYDGVRSKAFSKIPTQYTVLEPLTVKASEYGVPTSRTRVFFIGYDKRRFSLDLSHTDFCPPNDVEAINVAMALSGLPVKISNDWKKDAAEWQAIEKTNGNGFMAKITGEIPNGIGNEEAIKTYQQQNLVSGCQGTRHVPEVVARFSKVKPGSTDIVSRAMKLDSNGFCPTLRAGTGRERGRYQAIRPIHFSSLA
jgi:DNA (cytosine-5)-methyltransferase 1